MGYHDHSQVHLLLDFPYQGQDGLGCVGVQGAGGLVAVEDIWLCGQCPGYCNPLLLTSGEGAYGGILPVLKSHQLEHLCNPLLYLGLGHAAYLKGICHILPGIAGGEKIKVLENHPYLAAAGYKLILRQVIHPAIAVPDSTRIGGLQQAHKPNQR